MKNYTLIIYLCLFCTLSFSKDIKFKDSGGIGTQRISLNGDDWRIATDSGNVGIKNAWFKVPPVSASKQTKVPWVIQDIFHDYHGVAWYWREFDTPEMPDKDWQYLLKFHAVDYLADVWVNGKLIGGHEGNQVPFELNATNVLKRRGKNLLVVRVLNPTYHPIDNISLKETASSLKHHPYTSNAVYNSGGIIGDVELLTVPAVRASDLYVVSNWKTGKAKIQATVLNTQSKAVSSSLSFKILEARTGIPVALENLTQKIIPGTNMVEVEIQVPDHKLWSPDNPMLYRVTASVQSIEYVDEYSVRFGFRDFRFENGYYRLNGKRIFLKGTNFSTHYPVGYTVPLYEDMLRRDVVNMKALGMNFVRIPFGCPNPRVLDIYDELGIMVHQEHYGSWQMGQMGGYKFERPEHIKDSILLRFAKSISGVIKRDRNHPSIVMWGILNENSGDMVFTKAVNLLPSLRKLDPTRLMVLNSGRFDNMEEIGSMSSPESNTWDIGEHKLKDWHPYVPIPYSSKILDQLSGKGQQSDQSIYISESGLCFPIDLPSELGDYQRWGKEESDDALYFKRQYDKFLADWNRFNLNDIWARPEDYIKAAYTTAASLRETGESAIRSNPSLVAYTPTNGVADYSMGESVATNFRRLKPELIGSVLLSTSDLRWCLRTEPQSIYSGNSINLNISFSNLDVLQPGEYPATIQVVDPDMKPVFKKNVSVVIAESRDGKEPPFAQVILNEEIIVRGKPGKYHLLATLERGGTAVGGKTDFYVTNRADLPALPKEVILEGKDTLVSSWLKQRNVKVVDFTKSTTAKRQLIIMVGNNERDSTTMINVVRHLARGSSVIFLTPSTFKKGKDLTGWLPLVNKGRIEPMDHVAGYYRADRWAKNHPVFEGLHSGGMLDYKYFRNVISLNALSQEYTVRAKPAHTFAEVSTSLTYPSEIICGATRISHTYCSGINIGIWNFGEGSFMVNTLNIAENLGTDPAADRLFSNMLNYASKKIANPVVKLPEGFDQQLIEIGYKKRSGI